MTSVEQALQPKESFIGKLSRRWEEQRRQSRLFETEFSGMRDDMQAWNLEGAIEHAALAHQIFPDHALLNDYIPNILHPLFHNQKNFQEKVNTMDITRVGNLFHHISTLYEDGQIPYDFQSPMHTMYGILQKRNVEPYYLQHYTTHHLKGASMSTPEAKPTQPPAANEKPIELPPFVERVADPHDALRCIDGRQVDISEGAQMPGGSLLPMTLRALYDNSSFTTTFVRSSGEKLKAAGFKLGVHDGSHRHDNASDCGYADRLKDIVSTAIADRAAITAGISGIYAAHQDFFDGQGLNLPEMVDAAYQTIEAYDPAQIVYTGAPLIETLTDITKAQCSHVDGDHQETVAFVNLKPNTTLDTNALNQNGQQGFNFDVWAVPEQAKALGVDSEFAIATSLILYMATEKVLVEQKGKTAVPVVLHT